MAETLRDATPDAFVTVDGEDKNAADAPDPGALNVTVTPDNGLLPASFTVTARAVAKAVLTIAVCGVVPEFGVIVDGAPAVFVSEKLVESPSEIAVTA